MGLVPDATVQSLREYAKSIESRGEFDVAKGFLAIADWIEAHSGILTYRSLDDATTTHFGPVDED
jgi:hypothetical protein